MPPQLQTANVPGTAWQWIVLLVWFAGEALAVVFVLRVLARGGSPATTLLWVAVILAAPWLGMLLYYLFPRRLQLRRLRRLRQKQSRWRGGLRGPRSVEPALPDEAELAGESSLRRLLQGMTPDAVSGGNRVHWLPDGREFFGAAASAIGRAQTFVHLEVYIFRADRTGMELLRLLTTAAQRGVAVRLLYDSLGSFGLKRRHLAALRQAGGKAEPFLPLLWKRRPFTVNLRNHRKLLVVDGEVAFVGGRNIGDEYATGRMGEKVAWHDAMVEIGGPAVADLHHVFLEDWFNATDEELTDAKWTPAAGRVGNDVVGVTRSGPDGAAKALWFSLFQAISGARHSVDLSSPYLVPPPTLLVSLIVAAARGVRVRIFTNGPASEAVVLYQAQRSYYKELLAAGVEIFETVGDYNHAKLLVVDERAVMVGSANLDMRSAHLNFEVAVVLPDSPALANTVLATLEQRVHRWLQIDATALRSSPLRRIVDGVCRLLSPLL
jgi:cardiolipin synthase